MAETIHIHNYAGGEGPAETPGIEVSRWTTGDLDSPGYYWAPYHTDGTASPAVTFRAGKTYVLYELEDE